MMNGQETTQVEGIALVMTSFEESKKLKEREHVFLITASSGGLHYKVSSLNPNENTADLRSRIGERIFDRMRIVGADVIDEKATNFRGYIPYKVEVFKKDEGLASRCYADEKSNPDSAYREIFQLD